MKPLVNGKPEIANVPIVSRIIVSGVGCRGRGVREVLTRNGLTSTRTITVLGVRVIELAGMNFTTPFRECCQIPPSAARAAHASKPPVPT